MYKKTKKGVAVMANIKMWKFGNISYEEAKAQIKNKQPDFEQHNIIVTAGFNVLARLLAGDTTYSGEINYGALGTKVSPVPVLGDTTLGTEAYRKLVASQSADTNIAYIDFFYAAGDCNGTYTEFGNFIDGTAAADSGQLFSYIATGGWVKTALESLFVSCEYTLT
jgi:hypothetical protein